MTTFDALGEVLGEGASCRVYAWGRDRVVKVYRPAFQSLAPIEYERALLIHGSGIPSPAVHELVEVQGRAGVVFDRIAGPSLLDELVAGSHRAAEVGRTVAALHVAVHDAEVAELPQLADTLSTRGVTDVPRGSAAFHGDFHPGNVLRGGGRLLVIDWSDAHLAPAAADVACALVTMRYRGLRSDHPDVERIHWKRRTIADIYLDEYRAARPAVLEEVPMWFALIGRLLLRQEPDTAYADELRSVCEQFDASA